MNINCLGYLLWVVIYVDLMEMLLQIYVHAGIRLVIYSHLLEITIKMLQHHKNLIDLLILL